MSITLPVLAPPRSAPQRQADLACAHTLLGCVVRELAEPGGHAVADGPHLVVTLPRTGVRLRARLARTSTVGGHRFTDPVQHKADEWGDLDAATLAELVAAELAAVSGHGNDEFVGQVLASRDTLADLHARRSTSAPRPVGEPASGYLDSEQSLLAGHPRHPAPKWRSGDRAAWRRYAPEYRTAFPLHWLAVRAEAVRDVGHGFDAHARTAWLVGAAFAGHALVPVHPWQFRLLTDDPVTGLPLAEALADGTIQDLGPVGAPLHPTASVRTLYQPEADLFLKTSLNVRITNCVRRNAEYELTGAVALTEALAEPVRRVGGRWPGFAVLEEPAARSVLLPERYGTQAQRFALLEGLGCIVREGIAAHLERGDQVHLAGALAAAAPDPAGTRTRIADLADGVADGVTWAREWWRRYLDVLVGPVLALWARHGVVLEPHLQNVLVVTGPDGMPRRVLARDLEGTKLVAGRHRATLAALPPKVAQACAYDEDRAWQRIAYCLFVNHLAELAGALADLAQHSAPGMCRFEDELWDTLGDVLGRLCVELGNPPRLLAMLRGEPLPAKANLLVRWARDADRLAGYVPLRNPFAR
ncbi:IucA/IucC family protein [Labedaea rhizosphaerae]|uniref:Siderophore synthetase component n=1 Tax=Labedaea rhizosphaerae TaxID=598644 RepID=A0A4R6S4E7_LABRH|nr:IucA/IucC family protein [Labedaea rhizosphaerae]TDP93957.1 siderophore synthetase component [Labedaea rhizosphaerae]